LTCTEEGSQWTNTNGAKRNSPAVPFGGVERLTRGRENPQRSVIIRNRIKSNGGGNDKYVHKRNVEQGGGDRGQFRHKVIWGEKWLANQDLGMKMGIREKTCHHNFTSKFKVCKGIWGASNKK